MRATTVGMAWGLAALGINVTPRKAREPGVRAEGRIKRYGAHAAVSTVSVDVQGAGLVAVHRPNGSSTSTTIGTAPGLVQPSAGSVALLRRGAEQRIAELMPAGAVAPSDANDRHVSGRDFLNSLVHLRPGVCVVPDVLSSTVNPARVDSGIAVDVLHVTRATLAGFSSSTVAAPPVRHTGAARMLADVT